MTRVLTGLAAWLAGTALAVGLAWFGASMVVRDDGMSPGVQVINVAPTTPAATPAAAPGSPAAVRPRASVTPPASPSSPAADGQAASPSGRRSPATAAPSRSPSPSASLKPTPTPTPTPTGSAGGTVQSYTLAGGRVALLVSADSAALVTAMPDSGFSVETWSGTDWLRVDFTSGG